MEPMWSYDNELPEWYDFPKEVEGFEQEHLAVRTVVARCRIRVARQSRYRRLKARVDELKAKLAEIETQAPCISSDMASKSSFGEYLTAENSTARFSARQGRPLKVCWCLG